MMSRIKRLKGSSLGLGLGCCGGVSLLTTIAILVVLTRETILFFQQPEVSLGEFLSGGKWNPLLGSTHHYGMWPLVSGTVLITLVAMAVALPLGLITAIYLSEFAPRRVRSILKPTLEVLAGIPTVVFGYFAVVTITGGLRAIDPSFGLFNALSAGIAVGLLCLPIVSSLTEDALQAVPRSLREGAYALGATRMEVAWKVVAPGALSGIIAAFLLAIARAVGETMVVALAAGSTPRMTLDPRESVQTITGYMVQIFLGDVSNFGAEYLSSFAVAALLFLMTFALTLAGHRIRLRYREVYQ